MWTQNFGGIRKEYDELDTYVKLKFWSIKWLVINTMKKMKRLSNTHKHMSLRGKYM